MDLSRPQAFHEIAGPDVAGAFITGYPEVVRWLEPGTKLFKWTSSVTTPKGASPWWQLVEPVRLATGSNVPGIRELRVFSSRLNSSPRDFSRARLAVTEEWNSMLNLVGVSLVRGAWGYIGKAAGQPKNRGNRDIWLIGGEYQVWIPGLRVADISRINLAPYLQPNVS